MKRYCYCCSSRAFLWIDKLCWQSAKLDSMLNNLARHCWCCDLHAAQYLSLLSLGAHPWVLFGVNLARVKGLIELPRSVRITVLQVFLYAEGSWFGSRFLIVPRIDSLYAPFSFNLVWPLWPQHMYSTEYTVSPLSLEAVSSNMCAHPELLRMILGWACVDTFIHLASWIGCMHECIHCIACHSCPPLVVPTLTPSCAYWTS